MCRFLFRLTTTTDCFVSFLCVYQRVVNFLSMIRGPFSELFPKEFRDTSWIVFQPRFQICNQKYCVTNPKKVGNSYSQKSRKFRALGKISEWERMETLTMGQNTEIRVGSLEKNPEKRPRITFLKNEYPCAFGKRTY